MAEHQYSGYEGQIAGQSFRISTPQNVSAFRLQGDNGPLITIHSDGRVESPSLEATSEAGKQFVAFVRRYITDSQRAPCCERPQPQGHTSECYINNPINTTDELFFLSEIIDALGDDTNIGAALKVIRKNQQEHRSRLDSLRGV